MALYDYGIIRVPHFAVKTEIADKRLVVILKNVERMCAYYAKMKPLPAKTSDFINFLATSLPR